MKKAKILDGRWLAKQVHGQIKSRVDELTAKGERVPGLGVILVGDNEASKAYVGTNLGSFRVYPASRQLDEGQLQR